MATPKGEEGRHHQQKQDIVLRLAEAQRMHFGNVRIGGKQADAAECSSPQMVPVWVAKRGSEASCGYDSAVRSGACELCG